MTWPCYNKKNKKTHYNEAHYNEVEVFRFNIKHPSIFCTGSKTQHKDFLLKQSSINPALQLRHFNAFDISCLN